MKFELAEEVKHLTLEQLDDIYQRYMSGEKNKVLMEEYDIDAHANKLISLFPPVQHNEFECKYCSLPLYSKRQSKSGYTYSKVYFCLECSHIEGTEYNKSVICPCEKCSSERVENARIKREEDKKKYLRGTILLIFLRSYMKIFPLKINVSCYLFSWFKQILKQIISNQ